MIATALHLQSCVQCACAPLQYVHHAMWQSALPRSADVQSSGGCTLVARHTAAVGLNDLTLLDCLYDQAYNIDRLAPANADVGELQSNGRRVSV